MNTDEETQSQRGQEWLESLLRLMGVPSSVEIDAERLTSEGSYWLTIEAKGLDQDHINYLIGDRGTVLDAIQYLANTTLNIGQPDDQQHAYTVELAGYRAKRQQELKEIAEQAVEQVRETGQEFEIPSLSSAERRQVHTYLKEYEDLATESRGREPDRRLIVRLQQPDV